MRKIKTAIIVVVIVALLGGSASVGLNYIKQQNQTEVLVVSVGSLASDYYTEDTSLEGMVTTSVSQSVYQDKDMIIDQVHVSPGDSVKKGDILVSFDMTLVEMELSIEKLKLQKYQQDLAKAEKRLISLQNGGPIIEDSNSGGSSILGSEKEDEDELAFLENHSGQYYLATILPSMFTAVFGDGEEIAEDDFSGTVSDEGTNDASDIFGSGFIDPPQPTATPSPTPTPDLGPDMDLFTDERSDVITGISDGNEIFYEILDEESMPICGGGTEVDPYVFLCSSNAENIIAKGSFLNKMAGYTPEGTEIVKEGGYWYQLEFHQNNVVTDYNNRKASCTGYFLIDGCMLSQPVRMDTEMEFYQEDAMQYEKEELPEEPDIPSGGDSAPTISRADAIKSQKTIIASLQLNIAETELNIKKLEKKVNKKEIYSKIDGVVTESENSYGGDSGELFTIKSDKGFYVSGTVSELMRDQLKEGTTISCMSYEKGYFDAKITDISDYPTTSNSYWGNGNPNASYYTFSAEITDTEIEFTSEDWITITIPDTSVTGDKLVISRAFVRSENGSSYVYKDEQGVLKKQILSVGGSVDGGYSILINAGLTREDKIAFPYGKAVVEGAKTREGSIDELYGY